MGLANISSEIQASR